jgi:hypothetical protein
MGMGIFKQASGIVRLTAMNKTANNPVHQMQKAGAFINDGGLTISFTFPNFRGSLLHW